MRTFAVVTTVVTASVLTGTAAVVVQILRNSAQAVASVIRYVDTWNVVS